MDPFDQFAPPPFADQGLCAQTGPDDTTWFPAKGGSTIPAKRLCQGCPIKDACLQYAIANNIRYGVWGGRSERERDAIAKGESPLTPTQRRNMQMLELYERGTDTDGLAAQFGVTRKVVYTALTRARRIREQAAA